MGTTCRLYRGLALLVILLGTAASPGEVSSAWTKKSTLVQQDIHREIDHVIADWNTASNRRDYNALAGFYADNVTLYGQYLSRDEVLEFKRQYFTKFFDNNQQMSGTSTIESNTGSELVVKFKKKIFRNGTVLQTDATLTFKKEGDDWKIVSETDEDGSRGIKVEHKAPSIPAASIQNCDKATEAMLLGAQAIKKILVLPGSHYKLDSLSSDSTGQRYWYSVFPSSSQAGATRFSIDPNAVSLFEMLGDSAMPIPYDTAGASYIYRYCH